MECQRADSTTSKVRLAYACLQGLNSFQNAMTSGSLLLLQLLKCAIMIEKLCKESDQLSVLNQVKISANLSLA